MNRDRWRRTWFGALGLIVLGLAACSSGPPEGDGVYKLGRPYEIGGRWYYPSHDPDYDRVGVASWYGPGFHGRRTANGEIFDKDRLSAAHPTLPLPSVVRVTNLANGRTMLLRVNDRGPFVGDRLIDLSEAAARELGFARRGVAKVRVEFVRLADARGAPPRPEERMARMQTAAACLGAGGFIQVGAFTERVRAERLARELSMFVSAPVRADGTGDDRFTRVRLGPFDDARDVAATLEELRRLGLSTPMVVGSASRERAC